MSQVRESWNLFHPRTATKAPVQVVRVLRGHREDGMVPALRKDEGLDAEANPANEVAEGKSRENRPMDEVK